MYDGQCYKDFTCFTDISIADPDGVGLNVVNGMDLIQMEPLIIHL